MRNTCKFLLIAACCISIHTFAVDIPNVSELLDRYAANQDKLSSFIAKTEMIDSAKQPNEDRPTFMRWITEARVDGERTHIIDQSWDNLPTRDAPTPIADASHFYHLWDGDRFMIYKVGFRVDMTRNKNTIKHDVTVIYSGAPFLGIRFSDYERIDTVLRKAKTISVRGKLEQAGSEDCYVIDAKTTSGTYTVWIDPQHGYQIAQVEIRLSPGDHFRGGPLDENESRFLSIRNIRFKKIDGVWIPMEADIHHESIEPEPSQSWIIDTHHKITQMTLNPDHEALCSFMPVIENGTTVIDRDSNVRYTWRKGMRFVVDKWDGRIRYVPEDWSILVGTGKPLPVFDGIDLDITTKDIGDKAVLFCFFDMNQRPSRNCILQLSKKAQELKAKDVVVVAIQALKMDEDKLNDWVKNNNIPFPVGMVQGDEEKIRFTWGIRSLPWLILTDKKHIVRAEGFSISEFGNKYKLVSGK
jgi:hypothetical protein